MQCVNNGRMKDEDEMASLHPIVIDETSHIQHHHQQHHHQPSLQQHLQSSQQQQKVILSPRIEIHRIIKNQPKDDDVIITNNSNGCGNSVADVSVLQPVNQSEHTFVSPNGRSPIIQSYVHHEQRPTEQQRVHVIKDGRFYEEPRQHYKDNINQSINGHSQQHLKEHSPKPIALLIQSQSTQQSSVSPSTSSISSASSLPIGTTTAVMPAPPPQPESTKRVIINRQIIVNPNGNSNDSQDNSVNVVFRPPVVSSSCQPMRPPPPPPPPKVKCAPSEEPSSSIPDLGE